MDIKTLAAVIACAVAWGALVALALFCVDRLCRKREG